MLYFRPAGTGSFTLNATSSDSPVRRHPGQLPQRLGNERLERIHRRQRHHQPLRLTRRLRLDSRRHPARLHDDHRHQRRRPDRQRLDHRHRRLDRAHRPERLALRRPVVHDHLRRAHAQQRQRRGLEPRRQLRLRRALTSATLTNGTCGTFPAPGRRSPSPAAPTPPSPPATATATATPSPTASATRAPRRRPAARRSTPPLRSSPARLRPPSPAEATSTTTPEPAPSTSAPPEPARSRSTPPPQTASPTSPRSPSPTSPP